MIETTGEVFHHSLPLQLRFSDTDAIGHINNSVYFNFYDLGKTDYVCTVLGKRVRAEDIGIVLAHAETDFKAPTYYMDHVCVQTRMESIGHKSFTLLQRVVDIDTGEVKSVCRNVMVGFDHTTGRSMEISDELRHAMERYEGHLG